MKFDKRLILWLGKFAYPEINTKKTRLEIFESGTKKVYYPVMNAISQVSRKEIEFIKYGYRSKKRDFVISLAYNKELDALYYAESSLQEIQKNWWHYRYDNHPV